MPLLSKLQPLLLKSATLGRAAKRSSSHNTFPFEPTRWQWRKFKDTAQLYIAIGLIPVLAITAYVNIFIGPATLSEIPPDYEPKHWEYHRSPITRFIVRYIMTSPQQEYEKYLHHVYEEREKQIMRQLENEIKVKMHDRQDYQAYYYRPVMSKYHRISREVADKLEATSGD
ncbi:hypothetical protein FQA39_LY06245 [Lamprigera yunnana]|nr:hypothetical protein FQA39_LY06245 [Lamprigera yunnana]